MIKYIVGVSPYQILTPHDVNVIERIGQTIMTMVEYTMCLWDALEMRDYNYCFNYVMEGLENSPRRIDVANQPPDMDEFWDGLSEMEKAGHDTISILMRLHEAYRPSLGELPMGQGEGEGPIEQITVDDIKATYTVLNMLTLSEVIPQQNVNGYSTVDHPFLSAGCPRAQQNLFAI